MKILRVILFITSPITLLGFPLNTFLGFYPTFNAGFVALGLVQLFIGGFGLIVAILLTE